MENDDVTVRVLIDIRDRLDQTNSRLDHLREDLGQRIDQTNDRIDETNRRVTALGLHVGTQMTSVDGTLQDVVRLLKGRRKDQLDLSDRVGRVERDLADLKNKVG